MTLLELMARFGWPTLARFAVLVLAFVLVYAARWPVLALLWCLTVLLRRIDRSVTTRLSATVPPTTTRWRTT